MLVESDLLVDFNRAIVLWVGEDLSDDVVGSIIRGCDGDGEEATG